MQELEKPLPHDDLMERALLGAILAGHRQSVEVLDSLKPDDFYNEEHRVIVRVVLELCQAGTRPDLLSVHDELARSGKAEAAGGIAYVASLFEGVVLQSDILYVLRGLRRMASSRQVVRLADSIMQHACGQRGSVEALLDSAVEKFSNLARDL